MRGVCLGASPPPKQLPFAARSSRRPRAPLRGPPLPCLSRGRAPCPRRRPPGRCRCRPDGAARSETSRTRKLRPSTYTVPLRCVQTMPHKLQVYLRTGGRRGGGLEVTARKGAFSSGRFCLDFLTFGRGNLQRWFDNVFWCLFVFFFLWHRNSARRRRRTGLCRCGRPGRAPGSPPAASHFSGAFAVNKTLKGNLVNLCNFSFFFFFFSSLVM